MIFYLITSNLSPQNFWPEQSNFTMAGVPGTIVHD